VSPFATLTGNLIGVSVAKASLSLHIGVEAPESIINSYALSCDSSTVCGIVVEKIFGTTNAIFKKNSFETFELKGANCDGNWGAGCDGKVPKGNV
jgi:hypothetical protein